MLISRVSDQDSDLANRFEAFELSPRNNAVYQEAGRLHRSFPGSAVDIDLKVFAETGLVVTIARTLAKMSHQAAPGMQPQARKAGTNMDEDRDTTHPGMISELVMGFLNVTGHPAQVNIISKNTREEVLWRDARSPWRRSPVWMLLRVALQLKFPHDLYKEFIVFMMSRVINDSRNQHLSGDLCYAMMAKVARRVVKLSSPGNADVVPYGWLVIATHVRIALRWILNAAYAGSSTGTAHKGSHIGYNDNPAGKPTPGKIFVYGTQSSHSNDTLLAIHGQWNWNGTGGDKRGRLLHTSNFDDGKCYQYSESKIAQARMQRYPFPGTSDPAQNQELWCQNMVQLPELQNTALMTLYWIWAWPFEETRTTPFREDYYTTCIDLNVV
ncbi:hypothetical protein LTR12_017134 [Friedmanniomyces endolithicus]|nr:hypothetical protein LTR12_017134 [Friedmanniomyces endolithicus]